MLRAFVSGLSSLLLLSSLVGCSGDNQQDTKKPAEQTKVTQRIPVEKAGINTNHMDPRIRPQDDLYRYVNGRWLETFKLPPDKSNYGTFTRLAEENEKRLKQIVAEISQQEWGDDSEERKISDFYNTFMDETLANEVDIAPLKDLLAQIESAETIKDLPLVWAHLTQAGVNVPLRIFVDQDGRDATRYTAYLYQGGLSMPDRDYYIDPKNKQTLDAFRTYVHKLLEAANTDDEGRRTAAVMKIETAIAQAQWARVDNRDPQKTYNPFALNELDKVTSELPWQALIQAWAIEKTPHLVVAQPTYVQKLAELLKDISLREWKDYLTFRLLDDYAPYLSPAIADAHFEFHGKVIQGLEAPKPRWKRAIAALDRYLGEALGKRYVAKYFKPEAKKRMQQLVENLRAAFAEEIKQLDWMSEATKQAALEKLKAFRPKIGYPDKWKSYQKLKVGTDSLAANIIRGEHFLYHENVSKLGQPINRDEWLMTPQTVNAYYNPSMNEIVFPAAILQPPFFNMEADDAVNYGAIGAVIGHEMTHGFDDSGRQYDAAGNLRNWWTPEDEKQFKARVEQLVKFFDQFKVGDEHVNGRLTLGENIADLGGLKIAYQAYLRSLQGKPAPVIGDWTGAQRFFMGWAQVWARKYRPEELFRRLKTDPHSPSEFRANGPVQHLDAFHEAFHTKEGDKLYRAPKDRIRIW